MKFFLVALNLLIAYSGVFAQNKIENYTAQQGNVRLGEGDDFLFPYEDKGYTLFLPSKEIKGVIISLEDAPIDLEDSTQGATLSAVGVEYGFAYLHISTGIPVDLFFNDQSLNYIDSLLNRLLSGNRLSGKNIFLLGVMTAGHRALKYVEYAKKNNPEIFNSVRGIILCESAIDWVRQWYECQKQVRDHLTDISFQEGKIISYLFRQQFSCTPVACMEKYIAFSPYSYFDTGMKQIEPYKHVAIRSYSFADTDYWFSAPGKGVYDSNYPDMSGIINELKLKGNKKAELVVIQKENKSSVHTWQSSTWTMVNKKELMEWIIRNSN
jgi:hypothetical protein